MKKSKEAPLNPETCQHEDTYPVAFFNEQEFTDCAYLVVECDECNSRFVLVGEQLGHE